MEKNEQTQGGTLLEQTKQIRLRFWRGEINEQEALQLMDPFVKKYRRIAQAKAKQAGMRVPPFSTQKFLRERRDLRWDAQERQHGHRDGE